MGGINLKDKIVSYIEDKFNIAPEFIFQRSPKIAIFRHPKNKKWFAALLPVDAKKLNEKIAKKYSAELNILNLKCDPSLAYILCDNERIMPAYHMNKKHWISINLDSEISAEQIFDLIDQSFELTR
ncbi:MmcQ/YjbR family DNA-binding protein [Campylobacter sp. RM16192]|uniref:MmcQ/YjbR family DNA-binding protein n=1 Tax=Campylobacter sp. RM16192 TaxID=1660080 RepID=UPI0014513EAF|nr:MmcQ/YjbR family DNA-binding protein [Campylobacter sp. RM16192]QCD53046.1 putative DNA-binding protein, MmcQ/YjbR family [Campylobacter sp. RM16192]